MKTLVVFGIVGVMLALVPSEASAWYCRATSPAGAWGWGRSNSLYRARNIAYNLCTRDWRRGGHLCRIRYCVP